MARKTKVAKKSAKRRKPRKTEARVAYTVLHPVRLDILSILFDRVASASELARMLQKPRSTVSRHVTELKANHGIEVVGEELRGGATEYYYRATARPEIDNEELATLPGAARRRLAAITFQEIITEGLASIRHGRTDADDELNLSLTPMRLSSRGRDEARALQVEMAERLEAIRERDAGRPKDDAAPVKIAAIMWFDRGRPAGMPLDGGVSP